MWTKSYKGKQVWHVTTIKKLEQYKQTGVIKPPVRAWKTPEEALRFSQQTGRAVIVRLRFFNYRQYEGHRNQALETFDEIPYTMIK